MAYNGKNNRNSFDTSLPELPNGYLKNGYSKADIKLITTTAVEIAKGLTVMETAGVRRKNTISGVRNFYDSLVNSIDAYNRKVISDEDLLFKVNQLIAHVDYNYSKKNCTMYFVKFIKANVTVCKTIEDVLMFKSHFMAVYEEFNAISK